MNSGPSDRGGGGDGADRVFEKFELLGTLGVSRSWIVLGPFRGIFNFREESF